MINRIFSEVSNRIGKVIFAVCCILFWIIITDMVVGKGFFGDIFFGLNRWIYPSYSNHIAVVEFDYNSRKRGDSCDNRAAVFKVVDKLIEAGSKVVVLDFNFAENGDERIEFRSEYSNHLVFGSSIYNNGFSVIERKYPTGLFSKKRAQDVVNSGHLLLNDSLDAYPTARTIQHVLTSRYTSDDSVVFPSLSLVSYNLGENQINAEQLRQEIKNSQDSVDYNELIYPYDSNLFIKDKRFTVGVRVNYPELPTFFPVYSADYLLYEALPVEKLREDFFGKYVFVSSTWDLGVDRYAYGVAPFSEIITRSLARIGVVSQPIKNMIPGVYIHASALANMIGDGYSIPLEFELPWWCSLIFVLLLISGMHKLNVLPKCVDSFAKSGEYVLNLFSKKREGYHVGEGPLWCAIVVLVFIGFAALFSLMWIMWVTKGIFWEPTGFFLMYIAGIGLLVLLGDIEDLDLKK